MRRLALLVGKDLRLLWRDRAGLFFLAVAPLVVITVAGFSLASFYGTDPLGRNAYDLPVADEDGGPLAHEIERRLAADPSLHVVPVHSREEARAWILDRKQAGTALVIPDGTEAALRAGRPARLLLYTDAVKFLERLQIEVRLAAVRDALAAEQTEAVRREAEAQRTELEGRLEVLRARTVEARADLSNAWARAAQEREQELEAARREAGQARERAARAVREQLEARLASLRDPLRAWADALAERRAALDTWVASLRRLAGRHADEIPPPPAFPDPPPVLARWLAGESPVAIELPADAIPAVAVPTPPPLPPPPVLALPALELPAAPTPPGALRLAEVDVSGAGDTINTFDQNVPGFSVTFLLLGMLLGVSLGLLDETEWGTFERLRSLPVGLAPVLSAKLVARFVVGVAQMILLFALGRAAFHISLGPEPWALVLPIAGIVFSGAAFGLVVAALAPSRESVLPVGAAVIVSITAMGGCWWPMDLEPSWMRRLAVAFPTTWAMNAFNDLMIRHHGASSAVVPTAVMGAYGALYLVVGVLLFRWKYARAGG
jgi:ABC-type multidrug transport system permease subunit